MYKIGGNQVKKYLTNEKGLSLVEVVASVVLLVIILTAVYNILIQNTKTNISNDTRYTASAVAREVSAKITEYCSEVNYNKHVHSVCLAQNTPGNSKHIEKRTNDEGYQIHLEIDGISASNSLEHYNLRQVKISVWNKGDDTNTQNPKAITYTYQREVKN